MSDKELDEKILEILKKESGCTRYICNIIFVERTPKFTIIPGKEKMQWIYYRLSKMKKSGIVVSDYPGYWSLVKNGEQ